MAYLGLGISMFDVYKPALEGRYISAQGETLGFTALTDIEPCKGVT